MIYIIRGNLCGYVCEDCSTGLSNVVVRLYRAQEGTDIGELTNALPKETTRIFFEDELRKQQGRLLAETRTDKNGNYEFKIDGDQTDYDGKAVEIGVYFDKVPDLGQTSESRKRFQAFFVSITTFQPRWRETNTGLVAQWRYCFSIRWWCNILKLLDIWVICGQVLVCDGEAKVPVPGVETIAMDDDLISDDRLGSAITDASGRFSIYYTSTDFKKTFLSPFINVETPFTSPVGPDVYFKFAFNGTIFHEEPSSIARTPQRCDIGNCFCIELCIPEIDIIPGDEDPIAGFFRIGLNRRYHIVSNISPTTGLTANKPAAAWNDLAFFSNLALLGTLTKKLNNQPMEYLFEVREFDAPGGSPTSGWAELTPGQISNTVIGYTQQIVADPDNPIVTTDYAIHPQPGQQAVNFNGNWIQVPQLSNLILNQDGLVLRLISNTIMSGTVDMTGLVPGDSTTTIAPLQRNQYYQIRMKKREVNNAASELIAGTSRPIALFNTIYQNVPQKGSWLPTTADERGVACMDIEELSIGGGCSVITNSLNVSYTAANPNLGTVSLSMTGPGGPHSFSPVVFTTAGQEAHGKAIYSGNVASLPKCAYIVRISAELRLTNGESQHLNIWDEVAFCK